MVRLDENGDPMDSEPVSRMTFDGSPWVDVEPYTSLDRVEVMTMGRGDVIGLVEGLMRHQVRLLAMGYGDDSGEIARWFSEPEAGKFIVPGVRYAIANGRGAFGGLDRMHLAVDSTGDRITGSIFIDDDAKAYAFEHDLTPVFVAEFTRSTTPVG